MFPTQSNAFSTSLSSSYNRSSGDFLAGGTGGSGGGRTQTQANSRGGKKGNFCKNIVPVEVKTILNHRESEGPLLVHGIEVGLVCLVAQIRDVVRGGETDSNTLTFLLEDDTGSLEAVQYLQDDAPPVVPVRNTWAKIIGSLKAGRDQNMLTVLMVRQVESQHEMNAHLLEMAVLPVRMARLQGQAAALAQASLSSFYQSPVRKNRPAAPGGLHQPLSVRNIQTFPQRQQAPPPPQQAGPSPQTSRILATIRSCFRDNGVSRQEIYNAHKDEMTQGQVDESVDFLTSEGHIYTTINLHHFRSTDS